MKQLTNAAAPLLRQALGKQAPAVIELIKNWPEIVGTETAAITRCRSVQFPKPGGRTGGTLQLDVEPQMALFVEQDQVRILAAVNRFLGPDVIIKISLRQRGTL